ncbi:MAG: site-2 protease family protein [Deltaproteobacteria bacterium]|nr:site-2 protease family protein [Deltaproteobacteria bacterium]
MLWWRRRVRPRTCSWRWLRRSFSRFVGFLPDALRFFTEPLFYLCAGLIFINVLLAVFNMIPVPPLDGSGVLAGFLPDEWAEKYLSVGAYGMIIVLLLVFIDPFGLGLWSRVFSRSFAETTGMFNAIAGLP